ncbi:MAG: GNAT family N-acetyltransferase [Actinomycetota bacterium]
MQRQLPKGYLARPATLDDLDGVVELMESLDRSFGFDPDPVREEISWLWNLPSTDLGADTRLVVRKDEVVGYAEAIRVHPEHEGPFGVYGRVHPKHRGLGIGTWLAAWMEERARDRASNGIRTFVIDRDEAGRSLLESRGYVEVRSFFTMCRPLAEREEEGLPTPGLTVRPFRDVEEDRVLHDLFEGSFADHWEHEPTPFEGWNEALRSGDDWDPSLVWIAEAEGTPAGFLVGFLFERCGFVGILGVLREFRGRGIATALLRRSFKDFARRGRSEVRLTVDAQNTTGAVGLYERVGMHVCRRYDAFDLGTEEATKIAAGSTA